jgi:hypothetical protein
MRTFFEALVLFRPAHAPRVQQIHLERVLLEQLEEAVPLQVVQHREEGVRPRHAQRLAGLVGTPAAVPLVSPSMVGRRLRPSSFATAGITFSLRFRMSRKWASAISRSAADSITPNGNVARPFCV